jgi:hypothetical protein
MAARILTLGHMAKAMEKPRQKEAGDPQDLLPDQMRLYSFYKPGLKAGTYTVEAKQTITTTSTPEVGTPSLDVWNTSVGDTTNALVPQTFNVVVPRFILDPAIINSYYPPDGHQDEGRILPHIVLNDPHYPWEVVAGSTDDNMFKPVDKQTIALADGSTKTIFRGLVPWIALLVFDPEELRLTKPEDMTGLLPAGVKADFDKQDPKGIFRMKVSEYFQIAPSSRINFEAGFDKFSDIKSTEGNVDVIFPSKDQFKKIFQSNADEATHKVGVEAFKYLSHVRHIKTDGFPDAGVEEDGLFSIVMSPRTGAYDITTPKTQICHLVSIENVDSTLVGDWLKTPTGGVDRVGMISLFSWIYTALPPNPVNFVDTVRNLTENQQMLTVDQNVLQDVIEKATSQGATQSAAMNATLKRMQAGYTLARWRTQTGETTTAFNRGPLVPQPVPWPGTKPANSKDAGPLHDIVDSSNTSQDYQILDPQTGIMDISYASAWQIGKLLAISDTVFSASLMRFRSLVHNAATQRTLMELNAVLPMKKILARTTTMIAEIKDQSVTSDVDPQRVKPVPDRAPIVDLQAPAHLPKFVSHVRETVRVQASSGDDPIYNEFNAAGANNSDWAIIHTWLCNKLLLGGIPNHYLFPEPAFIPSESLRFFYIDDFWLDCFIDGALSVANHLDVDDDVVKRTIKAWFNLYLRTEVPGAGFAPQIPGYGFVIRSKVIKAMPDLRITVTWTPAPGVTAANPDKRAPVCRWTRIDDETLMCLLDRQPEELISIVLAQPPHQQRFSLGSYLDAHGVTFHLRKLFTLGAPDGEWPEKNLDTTKYQPNTWFNAQTRMLNIQHMADQLNAALQFPPDADKDDHGQAYKDSQSNSCEFGLELNDPSYYFLIKPVTQGTAAQRVRQLYIRQPSKGDFQEPATTDPAPHSLLTVTTGGNVPQSLAAQASAPHEVSVHPATPAHAPAVATPSQGHPPASAAHPPTPVHPVAATHSPPPSHTPTAQTSSSHLPTPSPSTRRPAPPSALPVPRGPSKQVRIQPTNPSRLSVSASTATTTHPTERILSRSSLQANFDIYIYPDHHTPPRRLPVSHGFRTFDKGDFIPTQNQYFFDLMFSIRKRSSVDTQIKNPDGTIKHDGATDKLLKIEVDIPMETPTSVIPGGPPITSKPTTTARGPKKVEPLLTDNYDGPGVHMLSNQRFVPFLFYHTAPQLGSVLHIELIPRSTALLDSNGDSNFAIRINDAKTDEISFRLAEANICATQTKTQELIDGIPKDADHGRGECTVVMTEWYSTPARPKGEPVATEYTVLKWDTRDD